MSRIAMMLALGAAAIPLAAAAAEESPPAKGKRLICREAKKATGSHIRTRQCRTEEEWRRHDEARLPISLRVVAPKDEGSARPQ